METLFIVDDENSIREGLKQIIDWNALGFELCGEASNGKDALSQILALNPSLVLLDVKMPGLHGTEVIRRAREAGFEGKLYSEYPLRPHLCRAPAGYQPGKHLI